MHPLITIFFFNCITQLYQETFKFLKIEPNQCSLCISSPMFPNFEDLMSKMELFFERYNFLEFVSCPDAILSLYNCGRTYANIIVMGQSQVSSQCFYESFLVPAGGKTQGKTQSKYTGHSVTNEILKLLRQHNDLKYLENFLFSSLGFEYAHSFREALNVNSKTLKSVTSQKFKLPDGTDFECNPVPFNEALYKQFFGDDQNNEHGLAQWTADLINSIDVDLRFTMQRNLVLFGGLSLTNGFVEEFSLKTEQIMGKKRRITAPPGQ